jgi:hypothetical protein
MCVSAIRTYSKNLPGGIAGPMAVESQGFAYGKSWSEKDIRHSAVEVMKQLVATDLIEAKLFGTRG